MVVRIVQMVWCPIREATKMSDLVPVKMATNVKAELESLKIHPRERLSDVVARLLAQRQVIRANESVGNPARNGQQAP